MKKYRRFIFIGLALVLIVLLIWLLYRYNYIPHKKYTNADFHIETVVSGFDLQRLVAEDIEVAPEEYGIEEPDDKIDFRRVRNLKVYFKRNAISLTTDFRKTEEWQGGDIVIFKKHIGIVSDKRNKRGVSFVLHNGSPMQLTYEEDILESWGEIEGHYRIK